MFVNVELKQHMQFVITFDRFMTHMLYKDAKYHDLTVTTTAGSYYTTMAAEKNKLLLHKRYSDFYVLQKGT